MTHRLSKALTVTSGLALLAILPTSLQAHHSFSIYDLDNPIEVTGVLTKFEFRNPHTILVVEVDGEEQVIEWNIESMNPRRWDSEGVERDIAQEGDIVTIKGWPAVSGAATMALGTVTSPQGTTVVRDRIRQNERGNRSSSRSGNMGGR